MRIGNHVGGICHAWSYRSHQDTWRTVCVIAAFRHEAGGVLVLGKTEVYTRAAQSFDQREHLATRDSVAMAAARFVQPARYDVSDLQAHRIPSTRCSITRPLPTPGLGGCLVVYVSIPGLWQFSLQQLRRHYCS